MFEAFRDSRGPAVGVPNSVAANQFGDNMPTYAVTLDDVRAAAARIAPWRTGRRS